MAYWEAPGKTSEWYTPPKVFEALGCRFDLDVAPARLGPAYVPAGRLLAGDGLTEPWHDFIWGNFPYSEKRNALAPWIGRFVAHGNGIALTPDRTSAPWFWPAWEAADAVLFTRKIRFLRPDGTEGVSPSNGTALFAMGAQGVAALERAHQAGLGILARPVRSKLEATNSKDPSDV